MSKFHHFAYYVPVTSFPNVPIDRSQLEGPDIVGTEWGKGSSFEYSARLRYNAIDPSGLRIILGKVHGTLPKRRVMLEAVLTVEEDAVSAFTGTFPAGGPTFLADETQNFLVGTRASFKVSTLLPKSYLGQAEPPKRTYDYLMEGMRRF